MTGVGLWQRMFDGTVSQSFFSRLPDLLLAHRAVVLVLPAHCCWGWWRLFFARFLNQGSRKPAERKGQLAGPCPECSDWVNNLTAPLVAGGLRRKAAGDLLVTHLFVSGLWYVWSIVGPADDRHVRGGFLASHVGCMRKGLYTFTKTHLRSLRTWCWSEARPTCGWARRSAAQNQAKEIPGPEPPAEVMAIWEVHPGVWGGRHHTTKVDVLAQVQCAKVVQTLAEWAAAEDLALDRSVAGYVAQVRAGEACFPQAACACRTQALAQENPQDAVGGGWRHDAKRAALGSVGLWAWWRFVAVAFHLSQEGWETRCSIKGLEHYGNFCWGWNQDDILLSGRERTSLAMFIWRERRLRDWLPKRNGEGEWENWITAQWRPLHASLRTIIVGD